MQALLCTAPKHNSLLFLAQCLVYALRIQPRVTPGDVAALVDLLHHMVVRTKGEGCCIACNEGCLGSAPVTAQKRAAGRGAGDLASWQQAAVVLVALVLALLPREVPGAGDDDADDDDQVLGQLAAEAEVARRLEGSAAPEDGFASVSRLAWGLLLAQHGPATARGACCSWDVQAARRPSTASATGACARRARGQLRQAGVRGRRAALHARRPAAVGALRG
jgi:hypothetical protein